MDPILITVYADTNKRLGCSTDDIAFDPDYRSEFLDRCRQSLGSDRPEKDLLKSLANLRKRSKLPESFDRHTFCLFFDNIDFAR